MGASASSLLSDAMGDIATSGCYVFAKGLRANPGLVIGNLTGRCWAQWPVAWVLFRQVGHVLAAETFRRRTALLQGLQQRREQKWLLPGGGAVAYARYDGQRSSDQRLRRHYQCDRAQHAPRRRYGRWPQALRGQHRRCARQAHRQVASGDGADRATTPPLRRESRPSSSRLFDYGCDPSSEFMPLLPATS